MNNNKVRAMNNVKLKIPKALREQVWLQFIGKKYSSECYVKWCKNTITVFDFQSGHDIPESKGGLTVLENLRPICQRCNLSMGNQYSITEWGNLGDSKKVKWNFFRCFK